MFRVAEGEGFEPPVPFQVQRFSSSTAGSEPLGKFPTLLLFSTGYKSVDFAPPGFEDHQECSDWL
jgi:hypothetical protein